eukprot:CAMPEP_0183729910 /NCGR_PEP_ID=MMETSP0737-20130205/31520_1 /TAXON_ID=385413 /ORGANISM="Thalassiosira miniscula, Strain CCMP1093" /LENGTH=56 /DNA_ID=CAMNT_0025962231 /DNA_START=133 /DNA_END=300 /DNA_ORIENTATION=-
MSFDLQRCLVMFQGQLVLTYLGQGMGQVVAYGCLDGRCGGEVEIDFGAAGVRRKCW